MPEVRRKSGTCIERAGDSIQRDGLVRHRLWREEFRQVFKGIRKLKGIRGSWQGGRYENAGEGGNEGVRERAAKVEREVAKASEISDRRGIHLRIPDSWLQIRR